MWFLNTVWSKIILWTVCTTNLITRHQTKFSLVPSPQFLHVRDGGVWNETRLNQNYRYAINLLRESHAVDTVSCTAVRTLSSTLKSFPSAISPSFLFRCAVMWQLPIVDVCLWLENLDFVKGLDMAAYWKIPCENFDPGVAFPKDSDIEQYVKERWSSEAEYAKARLLIHIRTRIKLIQFLCKHLNPLLIQIS